MSGQCDTFSSDQLEQTNEKNIEHDVNYKKEPQESTISACSTARPFISGFVDSGSTTYSEVSKANTFERFEDIKSVEDKIRELKLQKN